MNTASRSQTPREQQVLDSVTEILKKRLRPNKIILFGSRAKGKSHSGSDFDLAVDGDRPELTVERQIREDIEEISGLYSVDVVYLDSIDDEFKSIILKTGKTVHERIRTDVSKC